MHSGTVLRMALLALERHKGTIPYCFDATSFDKRILYQQRTFSSYFLVAAFIVTARRPIINSPFEASLSLMNRVESYRGIDRSSF